MLKKIAVFTGTRAEYGLLFWLLKAIQDEPDCELQLIVSGSHLSPEFGSTWQQIIDDGFDVAAKVEILLSSDSAVGVAKAMGLGCIGFADALDRLQPDVLIILGDRFEVLNGSVVFYRLGIAVIVILAFLAEIRPFKELWQENDLGSLTSSLTNQSFCRLDIVSHLA